MTAGALVATTEPSRRDSRLYRAARCAFRDVGNLEAAGLREAIAYAVADPFDDLDRYISSERLRALDDETRRRDRLYSLDQSLPNPHDRRYAALLDLARDVRERVGILDVLDAAGFPVAPVNRAGTEYAGPCPACGGHDRFRVWPGPPGRFWCRQCTWSGDVVTLTRNVVPGCESFADAVERLAVAAGVRP